MNKIGWPKTISEAKAAQVALQDKVRIIPLSKKPRNLYISASQMQSCNNFLILLKRMKKFDCFPCPFDMNVNAL